MQLHGVMLRRSKDQVLALPPKLRTWLPVEVPKGTGVRDMRKVVELLVGERELAPGLGHRRVAGCAAACCTRDEGAADSSPPRRSTRRSTS